MGPGKTGFEKSHGPTGALKGDVQTGGGKMVSPCVGRKESDQSDREAKTESTQLVLEDEGEPGPRCILFVGRYFWPSFCLYQS